MIDILKLKNFTVFDDMEIDFSPGINIIIGENGTGKTHLMKAAYVLAGAIRDDRYRDKSIVNTITERMIGVFGPLADKLGNIKKNKSLEEASLDILFDASQRVKISFSKESKNIKIDANLSYEQYRREPMFIPTKEILSLMKHSTTNESLETAFKSLFDETYTDLLSSLLVPYETDYMDWIDLDPQLGDVYPILINLIGGIFHLSEKDNYFQPGKYEERILPRQNARGDTTVTTFQPESDTKISNNMTAEGLRKLGILQHLILNIEIEPGKRGTLFWDEPESNINPKLVRNLVQILIELSKNGQQIVLATHDYVLLKWFDLLSDTSLGDKIRYHALSLNQDSHDVSLKSTEEYSLIDKTAIWDAFAELYDEDIKKALG